MNDFGHEGDQNSASVLQNIKKVYDAVIANTLRPEHGHVLCKYLEENVFVRVSEDTRMGLVPNLCAADLSHASRLLILLAASAQEAKQDPGAVQQLYIDLLMGTRRGLSEFFTLGSALSTLMELAAVHGPRLLTNSFFELPFAGQEITGLQPPRSPVRVDSMPRLLALVVLWCNVYVTLASGDSQGETGKDTCVGSVVPSVRVEFQFCSEQAQTTISAFVKRVRQCAAPPEVVTAVCHALVSLCGNVEVSDCFRQDALASLTGVLESLTLTHKHAADVPSSAGVGSRDQAAVTWVTSGVCSGGSNDDKGVQLLQSCLGALHGAFSALIGTSSSLRQRPTLNQQLANVVSQLLRLHLNTAVTIPSVYSSAIALHCFQVLTFCAAADPRLLPPLSLLLRCCVDVATQHACISLVSAVLSYSPDASSWLLQSLEGLEREENDDPTSLSVSMLVSSSGAAENGSNSVRKRTHFRNADGIEMAKEKDSADSSRKRQHSELLPTLGPHTPLLTKASATPAKTAERAASVGNISSDGLEFFSDEGAIPEALKPGDDQDIPYVVVEILRAIAATHRCKLGGGGGSSSGRGDEDGRAARVGKAAAATLRAGASEAPLWILQAATVPLLLFEAVVAARKSASGYYLSHRARTRGEVLTPLGTSYDAPLTEAYCAACQLCIRHVSAVLDSVVQGSAGPRGKVDGSSSVTGNGHGSGIQLQSHSHSASPRRSTSAHRDWLWVPLLALSRVLAQQIGGGGDSSLALHADWPLGLAAGLQQLRSDAVDAVMASLVQDEVQGGDKDSATAQLNSLAERIKACSLELAPPPGPERFLHWLSSGDLSAAGAYVSAFPHRVKSSLSSTAAPSTDNSPPLLLTSMWRCLPSLGPSLQAKFLMHAVAHARGELSSLLGRGGGAGSSRSRATPQSAKNPEQPSAVTLVLQSCLRLCCRCLERPPDNSLASVLESSALTCSAAVTALHRAFPSERHALHTISDSSVVLRRALDSTLDTSTNLTNPEGKLAVIHILRLGQRWSHVHRVTDEKSRPPVDVDIQATALAAALAPELCQLWQRLAPHIAHAMANFDGRSAEEPGETTPILAPGQSPSSNHDVSMVEAGLLPTGKHVSAKAVAVAAKRLNEVSFLEALTQLRTLTGAVAACLIDAPESVALGRSVLASVSTVSEAIDSTCDELLRRSHAVSHAVAMRLVQLSAVCMLSYSFQAGLRPNSAFTVAECYWGQEVAVSVDSAAAASHKDKEKLPRGAPRRRRTGDEGSLGPAGRLGLHLHSQASLSSASAGAAAVAHRDRAPGSANGVPRSGRTSSMFLEKDIVMDDDSQEQRETATRRSGARDTPLFGSESGHAGYNYGVDGAVISLIAHARFMRHSALVNPLASVWALSQITYVWAHSTHVGAPLAQIAYEELSRLQRLQLLQHMLVSNAESVVSFVLLPLLLFTPKPGTEFCRGWALRALFNEPFVSMATAGAGIEDCSSAYARYVHAPILAGLAQSPQSPVEGGTRRLLLDDQNTFHVIGQVTDLLDNYPKVLWQLLLDEAVQHSEDLKTLVGGTFLALLQRCANRLGVPVMGAYYSDHSNGPRKADKMGPFYRTTVQRAVLPAVWDLGSSDFARKESALKALRLLCTIIQAGALTHRLSASTSARNKDGSTSSVSLDADENVAATLPELFLYIMANVLEDKKEEAFSLAQRVQSVRCLNALVGLLRQADLVRFLPKIMSALDGVLGNCSPQLRYVGVELTAELVARLPHSVLCDHLSALVVGLYPSLDEFDPGLTRSTYAAHSDDALDALRSKGVLPPVKALHNYVREPSVHMPDYRLGMSQDLVSICEAAYAPLVARQWDLKARAAAVEIINGLFLKRRNDIKSAIQSVANLPNIPELANAHALQVKEARALSIEQTTHLLCRMLRHDSAMVRRMGLSRLLEVVREETTKRQLYSMLTSSPSESVGPYGNLACVLLQELLLLVCKEHDVDVLDACACCLGELGAIDPGRVHVALPSAMRKSASTASSAANSPRTASPRGGAGNALDYSEALALLHEEKTANPPPWECVTMDMGLLLLERHLVPGLRTGSQDMAGYGIQVILKNLVQIGGADTEGELPEGIRALLARRSILDVVEPFWITKYRIQAHAVVRRTPVYRPDLDFSQWISFWVRHILQQCSGGSMAALFEGCRGLMRSRAELSQFVLPHVVVSYLQQHGANVGKGIDNAVLWEICYVLSGAAHTEDQSSVSSLVPSLETMARARTGVLRGGISGAMGAAGSVSHQPVQAVFSLLDTLSAWASLGLQVQKKGAVVSSSAASSNTSSATSQRLAIEAQKTAALLHGLIDAVPKELLCYAALQVRAYTRALRYFEQHARGKLRPVRRHPRSSIGGVGMKAGEAHSPAEALVSSRRSDGSNGELPTLIPSEMDLLLTVYSKLGDPDALQGVQMIRRVEGHASTPWTRVLELEQTDDWLGALLEYGLLQDTSVTTEGEALPSGQSPARTGLGLGNVLLGSGGNSSRKRKSSVSEGKVGDSAGGGGIGASRPRRGSDSAVADSMSSSEPATLVGDNELDEDDAETVIDAQMGETPNGKGSSHTSASNAASLPDLHNLCAIEKGRLRCLIELGQLDSVVDQTLGMVQRLPALEPMLLPLGVEATWRLQQWGNLETFLERVDDLEGGDGQDSILQQQLLQRRGGSTSPPSSSQHSAIGNTLMLHKEDTFPLSVGRLLLSLKEKNRPRFSELMEEARRRTMASLAAASMESYGRAYPLLVRLHVLTEIETGYDLVNATPAVKDGSSSTEQAMAIESGESPEENFRSRKLATMHWDQRLNFMSPSAHQRSLTLAVRRTLLGAAGLRKDVARNWLGQSDTMRKLGRFDAARVALRSAEQHGVSSGEALLSECRILKDSGQTHAALMLIEPVEPDIVSIRQLYKESRKVGIAQALPSFLATQERIDDFVERLLLATQLMVQSKTKQGATIIERYKCIIDFRSREPKAYFELARYFELLYDAAKLKETNDNVNSALISSHAVSSGVSVASARSGSSRALDEYDFKSHHWVAQAVPMYLKAIYYCKSSDSAHQASYQAILVQALPRLLTLFMSFTALREADLGPAAQRPALSGLSLKTGSTNSITASFRGIDSLRKSQASCCEAVRAFSSKIPPAIWFSCLPQLVSRTGHGHKETLDIILEVILKVLIAYPRQSVWHVAGLLQSLIPSRRALGDDLVRKASASLGALHADAASMLDDATGFFRNLIDLAGAQHKEKRMSWKWPKDVDFRRFMVPMQGVLAAIPNSIALTARDGDVTSASALSGVPSMELYIQRFSETVDVASSKAKPKTIYLSTVCGKTIKFLCKQEKNGDLRKDARMMEFNTAVNRLFQADAEGRRRHLKLRTYAVVCLNEECGILEWVNNTTHLRTLIADSHTFHPCDHPNVNTKDVYTAFSDMQEQRMDNLGELVQGYRELILDAYRPCFHRWFLEAFPDPTAWYDARTTFTRSMAVWSAVGHVVGLGDRHTENVLIDTSCGECVHVDFDCVFDKGLTLARPEIVPFRLTPNLVDAMGLTGVEGTFRRTMEASLTVLRGNKEMLMAVLEPFLRDPTVAWGRGGRAQRAEQIATTVSSVARGALATHHPEQSENADAKSALEKISGRLDGVYNLCNPSKAKIQKGYAKRREMMPRFGLGAAEDESLPLSVEGQVQRLIDEAMAEENLVQMYIGWQPWA